MLPTEQREFFGLIQRCMGEYLKPPAQSDLEAWWNTCRVFTLSDVQRALGAHQMDPDEGHRVPRPIDVKRRLRMGAVEVERKEDPNFSARLERYREDSIRAPGVVNTAHAIALKHGDKPWSPAAFRLPFNGQISEDEHRMMDQSTFDEPGSNG